jgi:hypothetical protein
MGETATVSACETRFPECKAKQRRSGRTGRRLNLITHQYVFWSTSRGKWISLVTGAGRCFFIVAQEANAAMSAYFRSIS